MKRLFYYIFPLLSILAVSCRDDIYNNDGSNDDGTMSLSIALDVPESRTRAIDMADGAAVYLNKIWVGIYRKSDGRRVGGTDLKNETDLSNRLTESGAIIYNVVNVIDYGVGINVNKEDGNKFCVVAVANYDGIYSNKINKNANNETGTAAEYLTLFEELKNADTWKDFIDISINTRQNLPYATPLLMGYLSQTDNLTMVNQFISDEINKINISGKEEIFIEGNINDNGNLISLKKEENTNWLLRLRRLRSKINIKIKPGDGINITNLEYKVFNVPKSSFLAERKTNDMTKETGPEYSPNSSDRNSEGYEDDYYEIEWTNPQDNYNFSFEHFENKHWAYDPLLGYADEKALGAIDETKQYHERETKNSDGSLVGLVGDIESLGYLGKDHWNNNASYFILKMQILDENTNRNAEVEYTIHEGFINSIDGEDLSNEAITKRLPDFACIRNTDYTYNITVNGVNDIVTQVTTKSHENDQNGSVWQIHKFFYNKDNRTISPLSSEYLVSDYVDEKQNDKSLLKGNINENKNLSFIDPSEFAFRFIGTYHDINNILHPVDICYNFARGELDGFADLWQAPTSTTEYMVKTGSTNAYTYLENYKNNYFDAIIDNIKIIPAKGDPLNIKKYISQYIADKDDPIEIKGFWLDSKEYYGPLDNEVSALYIFDRSKILANENNDRRDSDHHSDKSEPCYLYQIYGVERYPILEEIKKEAVIYSNDFYTSLNNNNDLDKWWGARDIVTEMYWEHNPAFNGYRVNVLDASTDTGLKAESFVISKNDLNKYLKKLDDGRTIVVCPFPTTRYSKGNYTVMITPTYDGEAGVITQLEDILVISENQENNVTTWNFSKEPWTLLYKSNFTNEKRMVKYNGLIINHYNPGNTEARYPAGQSGNNRYIQFNEAGDLEINHFLVYVHEPGVITVKASNTGDSEGTDRHIFVIEEGKDEPIFESGNIPKSSSPVTYEISVNPDKPTKYYIYCNNNCRYYQLTFKRNR